MFVYMCMYYMYSVVYMYLCGWVGYVCVSVGEVHVSTVRTLCLLLSVVLAYSCMYCVLVLYHVCVHYTPAPPLSAGCD